MAAGTRLSAPMQIRTLADLTEVAALRAMTGGQMCIEGAVFKQLVREFPTEYASRVQFGLG